MADDILLEARDLTRYYHGRRVLHGIDLELRRGEVLGFLGPNGAGKSTTMNILCGVMAPHGGKVSICGHDLAREPLQAKRHLGYLPEIPPLHLDATVDEYLWFCARLRRLGSDESRAAVAKAKRDCDLDDVGPRLIGNLSKGFRQRVGIAQALLHQPAVVVLDEPTSGLDPNQIRMVRDTIQGLSQHHAVILSTHVLSEAQAICSRVAILHHGRIAFNQPIGYDGDTMRVRLNDLRATPEWAQLDGVIRGEPTGPGCYQLQVSDFDLAAESLCRLAVEHGWGVRELRRDTSPLEQVFVDLTCNESNAAA
jgi:ABC-2 type transport system ATP-binding protein